MLTALKHDTKNIHDLKYHKKVKLYTKYERLVENGNFASGRTLILPIMTIIEFFWYTKWITKCHMVKMKRYSQIKTGAWKSSRTTRIFLIKPICRNPKKEETTVTAACHIETRSHDMNKDQLWLTRTIQ